MDLENAKKVRLYTYVISEGVVTLAGIIGNALVNAYFVHSGTGRIGFYWKYFVFNKLDRIYHDLLWALWCCSMRSPDDPIWKCVW